MSISQDGDPHDAGAPDATPVETAPKAKGKGRKKADKPKPPHKPRRRRQSAKQDAKTRARRERMNEALEYRCRGYKYREIAQEMKIDVASTYKLVQDALAELPREKAEELRAIELDRLDTMLTKLMDQFLETPDPMYSDQILKLMGARAKYTGLLDQPKDPGEGGYGKSYDGTGGKDAFAESLKADRPQLQLPAPIVLKPDEPIPANPIL